MGSLLVGSSSIFATEMSYYIPSKVHTFLAELDDNSNRKNKKNDYRRMVDKRTKTASKDNNYYGKFHHHHAYYHRQEREEGSTGLWMDLGKSKNNRQFSENLETFFPYQLCTPHHPTPYHLLRTFFSGLLCFTLLGGRMASTLPSDVSRLGAYYFPKGGLPATLEYGTGGERTTINTLGRIFGCHTCGIKNPQSFIADHMPPRKVFEERQKKWGWSILYKYWYKHPQVFVPQCNSCSSLQSTAVKTGKRKLIFHWNWQGLRKYHSVGGILTVPSFFGIEHNLHGKKYPLFTRTQKTNKRGLQGIDKEAYHTVYPYLPLLDFPDSLASSKATPSITEQQQRQVIENIKNVQKKKRELLGLPLDLDSTSFNIFEDWLIKKSWAIDHWFLHMKKKIEFKLKEIEEEWS